MMDVVVFAVVLTLMFFVLVLYALTAKRSWDRRMRLMAEIKKAIASDVEARERFEEREHSFK